MSDPCIVMMGMGLMGRPYAERAQARGARLVVVDNAETLHSEQTRAVLSADDIQVPVGDRALAEDWFGAALTAVDGLRVAAVLPFTEQHVIPAALLADRLGVTGVGLGAALVGRNKALQRMALAQAGVPQPAWAFVHTAEEAGRWASGRYPVVLKPTGETGSAGVRLATAPEEVTRWVAGAGAPGFLVEEYVEGREVSAECLLSRGELVRLALTRKTTTGPPQFVEIAQEVVPDRDDALEERVRDVARQVGAAVGARTCLMHLELLLVDGRPHVIEIALRTAGDYILELHALAGGPDFFDGLVATALRQDLGPPTHPTGFATTWYPEVPPGSVVAVHGLQQAHTVDGVVEIQLDVGPGDVVRPLTSSDDRPVAVVIAADDRTGIEDAKRRVAELLRIETAAGAVAGAPG